MSSLVRNPLYVAVWLIVSAACALTQTADQRGNAPDGEGEPAVIREDRQRGNITNRERGEGQGGAPLDGAIHIPEQWPRDPAKRQRRAQKDGCPSAVVTPNAASAAPTISSGASSGTVRRLAIGAISETWWNVTASTGNVASCAAMVTASSSAITTSAW